MNYEKKYKEALERARKLYEQGTITEILSHVFPELQESEDERIKTKLIEFFAGYTTDEEWWGSITEKDILTWLKKQGGQKPTNNVEPKFHEGDLVVNTVGDTNQVVKVLDDGYTLDDNTFLSNSWATEHYHLWTIKDAKDGDVLSYENEIFIVKKSVNINILYYCCYDRKHFIIDSFYSLTIDDIDNIRPATKEQRDALMKAMADAGYTFDFEKKELKKIEHKSKEYTFKAIPRLLEMIQPTDRAKSYCQKLIDSLEQEGYSTDAKIVRDCLKQMNGEKVATATMDEQKPAWSEEDEKQARQIERIVHDDGCTQKLQKQIADWFKSIKYRVQPQPKQEWSERDKVILGKCLDAASGYYSPEYKQCMKDWLNSLKPRHAWKPTEEQMGVIEAVINNRAFQRRHLNSLYEQLKKLREE